MGSGRSADARWCQRAPSRGLERPPQAEVLCASGALCSCSPVIGVAGQVPKVLRAVLSDSRAKEAVTEAMDARTMTVARVTGAADERRKPEEAVAPAVAEAASTARTDTRAGTPINRKLDLVTLTIFPPSSAETLRPNPEASRHDTTQPSSSQVKADPMPVRVSMTSRSPTARCTVAKRLRKPSGRLLGADE